MTAASTRPLWARRPVLLGQAQCTRSWTGRGRKLPDPLHRNESLFGLPGGLWVGIPGRYFYVYFPLQTTDNWVVERSAPPDRLHLSPAAALAPSWGCAHQLVRCSNRTVSKTSSTSDLLTLEDGNSNLAAAQVKTLKVTLTSLPQTHLLYQQCLVAWPLK